MKIKEVQLDVAKPKDVDIEEIAKEIAENLNVDVEIRLTERNIHTDDIGIIISGDDINIRKVSKFIEELGLRIRSVDGIKVTNE